MSDFWINTLITESPWRPWDRLILGGYVFPGVCRMGCGVGLDLTPNKIQTHPAEGSTPPRFAITLTDNGYAPGEARAYVEIWTKDQWDELKATLPVFSPKTDKTEGRDAFDLDHPVTNLVGINTVIVKHVELLPIQDQTLITVIDMIQYFPRTGTRTTYGNAGPALTDKTLPPKAVP